MLNKKWMRPIKQSTLRETIILLIYEIPKFHLWQILWNNYTYENNLVRNSKWLTIQISLKLLNIIPNMICFLLLFTLCIAIFCSDVSKRMIRVVFEHYIFMKSNQEYATDDLISNIKDPLALFMKCHCSQYFSRWLLKKHISYVTFFISLSTGIKL